MLNCCHGCGFARGSFTQHFKFTAAKKSAAGHPVAENIGVGNRVLFLNEGFEFCFRIKANDPGSGGEQGEFFLAAGEVAQIICIGVMDSGQHFRLAHETHCPKNSPRSVPIVSQAFARGGNSGSQPMRFTNDEGPPLRISMRWDWQAMPEISVTNFPLRQKATY